MTNSSADATRASLRKELLHLLTLRGHNAESRAVIAAVEAALSAQVRDRPDGPGYEVTTSDGSRVIREPNPLEKVANSISVHLENATRAPTSPEQLRAMQRRVEDYGF
ncbi:MAG: hypothetical protein H0X69_15690 [Gemmatimonadales bacterium]|nr:hypothetical protein [Gemmatimonadales bacterium]